MTAWQAIVLGFVQGASEFLPISSSGHLVIFQKLLNVNAENIYLEVALHFGTLIAVIAYFRSDLLRIFRGTVQYLLGRDKQANSGDFRLCCALALGTLPVAVGGLLFKKFLESMFESAEIAGAMLLVTAAILLATSVVRKGKSDVNYPKAFLIGVAQLVSVLPGISRSGSTIAAAMFLGVDRTRAARFSFLLSVPAVTAAFLLKLRDLLAHPLPEAELFEFGLGALVACIVGLIAIHYLLKVIAADRFYLFGFWCLIAGIVTLGFI